MCTIDSRFSLIYMNKKIKEGIIFVGVFAVTSIAAFAAQRFIKGQINSLEIQEEEDEVLSENKGEANTEQNKPKKVVAAESSGGLVWNLIKVALQPTRYLQTLLPQWQDSIQKIQSNLIQQSIFFSVVLISMLLALFFLSLLAAFWLNDVLESKYWGFGVVAGLYLLIGLIAYLSKPNNSPSKLEKGSENPQNL